MEKNQELLKKLSKTENFDNDLVSSSMFSENPTATKILYNSKVYLQRYKEAQIKSVWEFIEESIQNNPSSRSATMVFDREIYAETQYLLAQKEFGVSVVRNSKDEYVLKIYW